MRKVFLTVALIQVCSIVFAQTQHSIKVTDMLKISNAVNVAISPDGDHVVYSVKKIEPDPSNKDEFRYVTQLFLCNNTIPTTSRQITYAREGAGSPAWSPDGKRLAFVRTIDNKPQIFVLSLDGGEPVQITRFRYGAGNPVWSPDGKKILFTSGFDVRDFTTDTLLNRQRIVPEWSFEKPGFYQNENLRATEPLNADPDGSIEEIRTYLDRNEKESKAKVINHLHFQEEATVSSRISLSHIFLADVDNGGEPVDLTPGFTSCGNASFSPDGTQIYFQGSLDQKEHPNRVRESAIYVMNINGTALRLFIGKRGMSYHSPVVSTGGKMIAFQFNEPDAVGISQLAVMPVDGTTDDIRVIPYDRDKFRVKWAPGDRFLYFTSSSNGGFVLSRVNVKNLNIERLTDFDSGIGDYDVRDGRLAFAKTEARNPSEIYLADAAAKTQTKVTSLNEDWLKDKKLSTPERKSFTNELGQTVEYWVMKPVNYEDGKKYPVILEIHGGPNAMWGPGESTMWHEFQFFCAMGYGVVYANPRGSAGYGQEFLRANIRDWGKGPASDVLTALDRVVSEGWVDNTRMAVTGGSYGGYLVTWIIAHDNRFKAACTQRGVYELSTFFGEGNAWRLVPNYFGGYPWEKDAMRELYEESPLSYVANIKTPLIIFHGENDLRTGVIQSEMLYKSLKVLNRPVEYVRHPMATHEITRSGNNRQRIDQMLRTYEFFYRWFGPNQLTH